MLAGHLSLMLITGIKSCPVYTVLWPDATGRYHVLVGQGNGAAAIVREGAALHRNPRLRPDDHKFVYGHIWRAKPPDID